MRGIATCEERKHDSEKDSQFIVKLRRIMFIPAACVLSESSNRVGVTSLYMSIDILYIAGLPSYTDSHQFTDRVPSSSKSPVAKRQSHGITLLRGVQLYNNIRRKSFDKRGRKRHVSGAELQRSESLFEFNAQSSSSPDFTSFSSWASLTTSF